MYISFPSIHVISYLPCKLREYPKGLGKALVKIYRDLKVHEKPLACLRQKAKLDYTSDLHLFNSLPLGDTWPDASLKDVYLYLWHYKKTHVPKEWVHTLLDFTKQLREATSLHIDSCIMCLPLHSA